MNAPKHKIVVLVCYFGHFPWYFNYFLHSCKYNPTVDFLIFTDIDYSYELPSNVVFVKKSLQEIRTMASNKLGYGVNMDSPYKLCDYKPALGFIFSEYIDDYDFWGHSDIDIIFGDIRSFITEEVLDNFDFISSRPEWTTGFFTLSRNNELMRSIFGRGKDCRKVFTDARYRGFDEFNFLHMQIDERTTVWDIKTEIDTFTYIIKTASRNKEINAYFDFISLEGVPGRIRFDNGKIIYKNTLEAMLYHLYWLKRIYNPSHVPVQLPERYFISPTRIYY